MHVLIGLKMMIELTYKWTHFFLFKKLNDTPTLPQLTLASLDIKNLYTNIPVNKTREIITNTLEKNLLDPQT
jgi:hypothetical protein